MTSYLFYNESFIINHLKSLISALKWDGSKLVIDLSCRRQGEKWFVATNKWQTITDLEVNQSILTLARVRRDILANEYLSETIKMLEEYCSEFLIHAADNEGLQKGIDEELVKSLGEWCTIPVTYAGGAKTIEDLAKVHGLSGGKVDLTIGSALDIFGGQGVTFEDCVDWNHRQRIHSG